MLVLIKHLANQGKTFMELNPLPPPCVGCKYYQYDDRRSLCRRTSNLKVFNVITGEYADYAGPTRCQDQRYGTHESYCGIRGKFFQPV